MDSRIKSDDHFKLHIPFRDKILFESELTNNDIAFYYDEDQVNINSSIRYLFNESDAKEIDSIIRKQQIIASFENQILDYRDEKKAQKLYLIVALLVVVVFLFASAVVAYFN